MDAFAGVQVCQGTRDVRGEGEPELPGKWFGLVVDVYANVAVLDKFRDDENAVVGGWGAAEADEETDVGVAAFFHESPFAFKVFGDVVFGRGEDFLDRDVDSEVRPCSVGEFRERFLDSVRSRTFIHVPKRTRSQLFPITLDILSGDSSS